MAPRFRVFITASSAEARARLVAEATRAGWEVVDRRDAADALLAETGESAAERAAAGLFDRPVEALTPRERDVIEHLAEGAGNRAIARRLGLSEHTVKFHLAAIFGKLGVSTRTEAVRRALEYGLIDL